MLSAMRFKTFVWPHNPRDFKVVWQRRVTVLDAPGGRYFLQEIGKTCRTFQGVGEFCGPDAYKQLQKLARVFQEDGPGLLVHPLWDSRMVYFTRLELTQEPRQDYVAYTVSFTEVRDDKEEDGFLGGAFYLTVGPDDTAWSIAQRYSLDIAELLQINPKISNPNLLKSGQEVRLR